MDEMAENGEHRQISDHESEAERAEEDGEEEPLDDSWIATYLDSEAEVEIFFVSAVG